jgi:hypothetical protein
MTYDIFILHNYVKSYTDSNSDDGGNSDEDDEYSVGKTTLTIVHSKK